ncbi:conjugal transfer protein TraB [Mesorhizobium sp.]|uniref:conjugal transfer protein TraB n=1 Tax=Mesorhizobium sp. TaxID=1871066 RepID=UPI0025C4E6FE|nr:conjugal transfer protein TraB [Mesorhizobium sp.]
MSHAGMLIGLAIVVGIAGWSGHVLALPVAFLFPALWAFSRSRLVAAAVSAGYFLAASRGLPQGVANFYASDLWPGLLLWIAASSSFVGVHAALWTKRPGRRRALRYLAAAVLMALPPFGIVGWAHPITAAGVVFPGWGWFGLAAAAAGLLAMTTKWWPAAAIVLGGFWLWSAATWTPPSLPDEWTGVDLELGQSLGRDVTLERQQELLAAVRRKAGEGARIVVLPESALGFWTPTVDRLWRHELGGTAVTVVAGAAIVGHDGYDNVLFEVWAEGATILYRERMPVPVSMWQPWRGWLGQRGGARAHFFANPVVELDGARIAPLICYEQLVVWPVLLSMLFRPSVIVATGNGWWTAGTSIVAIQNASAIAWARLFRLPLVTAFNR